MTEVPPPTVPRERALFITHHIPDMDHVGVGQFEKIVPELKKIGFSKHRFDVRWATVNPTRHTTDEHYLKKSAALARVAHRQGLEPMVILSSPPKWAYKDKSPEEMLTHFRRYAEQVKTQFAERGIPVKSIQLLNELNNPMYTPRKFLSQIPAMATVVREVFGADTDVSATVVLAKPWTNAERFITKHQQELSSLSSIGLDFYPGTYQHNRKVMSPKGTSIIARQALEAIATGGGKDVRQDFLQLLTDQMTDVSKLKRLLETTKTNLPNAKIDIGEFGFPTLDPIQRRNPKHEILQSYAVDKIASAMVPVVNQYGIRNIGFYELFDDKELGVLNWGMLNDKGEAKKIAPKLPDIMRKLGSLPRT